MSVFFVDTSALAKRYISEKGSNWVKSWIVPAMGHDIIIAHLTLVEMVSILARRQRDGLLTKTIAHTIQTQFMLHAAHQYQVIQMNRHTRQIAQQLLIKYPLRTLDAIQLACTLYTHQLISQSITFVSGDKKLLTIAAQEGFTTEDPNTHP